MNRPTVGLHLDETHLAVEDGDPIVTMSHERPVARITIAQGTFVFTAGDARPGDLSAYLRRVADKLDLEYGRWDTRQEQVPA